MTGMPIEFRIFNSGVSVPESATICICSRQRHTGHSFFIVLPEQHERSEAESENEAGPTCLEPVAQQGRIFLELEPGSRELLLSQQGRAFSTTAGLHIPLQQQGKANAGAAVTPTKQQHRIRAIERFKLDPDGNSPIP
ncbi:MAG: hypothetical protein ACLQPD_37070 [Desulfomonilaceae bacterium]